MNEIPEKEIIHEFDTVLPEEFYTVPLACKRQKIEYAVIQLLLVISIIEMLIALYYDHSSSRYAWLIAPIVFLCHAVKEIVIMPKKLRKRYEKISAEREDHILYTLYDDSVKLKTESTEVTLKYADAEGYYEYGRRIIMLFSFGRRISFDKEQCTDEQVRFIKNIAPEAKQKKVKRKRYIKTAVRVGLLLVYAVFLGALTANYRYVEKNTYYLEYRSTTYESFLNCLNYGTVDDVLIIKDKYVEYTYTGKGKNDRYYTVSDDIEGLKEKLDKKNVKWSSKKALYCWTKQ